MVRDSRDKVEGLISAALEAFAASGLEGTRVDAIARTAGMNKRLLYHYVGDKAALFDAAVAAAVERLAALDPPADDPAAWRLLCHASAVDRCPDLSVLADRLARQPAAAIGERLLAGLLPELAAALASPTGRSDAPGSAEPSAGARSKPRIKLRPALSSGSSSPG